MRKAKGRLVWMRELRLCIVPDGHGGFAAAIETRPRVEVEFDEDAPMPGRHHVIAGHDPELSGPLFHARTEDGGDVWPHVLGQDGQAWRLSLTPESHEAITSGQCVGREAVGAGWDFEPDPVGRPGKTLYEPWYLSYTPATAPYLQHWLGGSWRLEYEGEFCPWHRENFTSDREAKAWHRNLPPFHELNFPDNSSATWVECCLHNGLIETALQAAIDQLKQQVSTLQGEWLQARDRHSTALLKRWKTDAQEREK